MNNLIRGSRDTDYKTFREWKREKIELKETKTHRQRNKKDICFDRQTNKADLGTTKGSCNSVQAVKSRIEI